MSKLELYLLRLLFRSYKRKAFDSIDFSIRMYFDVMDDELCRTFKYLHESKKI